MSLSRALQHNPERFEFIQAVRLLRALTPGRPLRFDAEPMPDGLEAEVRALDLSGPEARIRLGLEALSGVRGVLPPYLYERLLASLHREDQALDDFLNLFNHRFFQLQQSERERASLLLRDEQERAGGAALGRLPQRQCLRSLAALPTADDSGLLRYSLLLGLKTRSLGGLRRLLSDYFALPIHVDAVAQSRARLPATSLTRLGGPEARNNRLGQGLLLGRTGLLHFQRLEIRVQPRDRDEYRALLADSGFAGRLRALVRTYLREATDLKLYLQVRRDFIAEPQLSSRPDRAVRLGKPTASRPGSAPGSSAKFFCHKEKSRCRR
ncbi:type VI secretion system baseplate subunit TssG [Marinobacterium aestuariivivens]